MIYTKPEINEIGSAAEMIQGGLVGPNDVGQAFPLSLSLLDLEE